VLEKLPAITAPFVVALHSGRRQKLQHRPFVTGPVCRKKIGPSKYMKRLLLPEWIYMKRNTSNPYQIAFIVFSFSYKARRQSVQKLCKIICSLSQRTSQNIPGARDNFLAHTEVWINYWRMIRERNLCIMRSFKIIIIIIIIYKYITRSKSTYIYLQ